MLIQIQQIFPFKQRFGRQNIEPKGNTHTASVHNSKETDSRICGRPLADWLADGRKEGGRLRRRGSHPRMDPLFLDMHSTHSAPPPPPPPPSLCKREQACEGASSRPTKLEFHFLSSSSTLILSFLFVTFWSPDGKVFLKCAKHSICDILPRVIFQSFRGIHQTSRFSPDKNI